MCQRLYWTPSACQVFYMLFCLIIHTKRDSPFENEVISVSSGYLTTLMPQLWHECPSPEVHGVTAEAKNSTANSAPQILLHDREIYS